ncbi:MAG: DMT family transporter [Verrucomicrobiota bacterium]|nr:DMT family transporter [Verrucomicrobiota bacterium]
MLASFLTTILFSLSVIFAARSAHLIGGARANLARITLATALLAIWAHGFGGGLRGPALPWFLFGGVIGFGLGDLALFAALMRIGPRLAVLLTHCLAAPFAALLEWAWLGTRLTPAELWCAVLILAGVAIALAPDRGLDVPRRVFWLGVLAGIGSALGQGFGSVISRKANEVAVLAQWPVDGGTAAYQRILGGVLVTGLAFLFLRRRNEQRPPQWREAAPWVAANALAGPSIGVGCFQWALATTPSGIVLPIVATSPVMTILLAWWIDGVKPTRRAVTGGVVAVAGVIALKMVESR